MKEPRKVIREVTVQLDPCSGPSCPNERDPGELDPATAWVFLTWYPIGGGLAGTGREQFCSWACVREWAATAPQPAAPIRADHDPTRPIPAARPPQRKA